MPQTYATTEFADEYFRKTGRFEEWGALSHERNKAALTMATVAINAGRYKGGSVPGQLNAFPRASNGGVLPEEVRYACCEEAYARFCDREAVQQDKRRRSGLKSVSLGNGSKSYGAYSNPGDPSGIAAFLRSEEAAAYLRPWLLGTAVIV